MISSRYGWRLLRTTDANGAFLIEWRCPNCWAKYKKAKAATATPLDGVPAVRGFPGEGGIWTAPTIGGDRDEPPSSKRADIDVVPPPGSQSGQAPPSSTVAPIRRKS